MKIIILTVMVFLTAFSAGLSVSAEIPRGSLGYSPEDRKSELQQKTEYNRAYWTLFSLIASSAAYAPDDGIEAVYLKSHGWEFEPNRITDGKTTVHFITARGIMADGKPLYVIAFRGSADKKDWAADFVTGQVVYGGKTLEESEKISGFLPGGAKEQAAAAAAAEKAGASTPPKVHKGFNSYADLTLRMLLTSGSYEFLEQFCREKDARLLLTGHSLGGAVATIVGQRLIDFGFDPDRLQVITFGAPAVGNKAFKQMYGDRLDLIRVTNSEDPVPLTLQAVLRNYRQFGEEVRFRIPRTFNNMNHFLHLYLDAGLKNYYSAFDASVAEPCLPRRPPAILPPSRPLPHPFHPARTSHPWPRHPPLGGGRVLPLPGNVPPLRLSWAGGMPTLKTMKTAPRTWKEGGKRMGSRSAGVPPAGLQKSGKQAKTPMFSMITHPPARLEAAPPEVTRCLFRRSCATSGGAASCRAGGRMRGRKAAPHLVTCH